MRAADEALAKAVAALKKRGINHPYVKNYVLARTSPLTRARKTVPSFDQAFARLVGDRGLRRLEGALRGRAARLDVRGAGRRMTL